MSLLKLLKLLKLYMLKLLKLYKMLANNTIIMYNYPYRYVFGHK